MDITLKKSSMVRPAQETPRRRLWNSDLDLLVPALHIPIIYSYKPNPASSNFFDTGVLKEALSNILVPFYPMAGRLGRDERGRIEIICNAEGVLFIEAETSLAMADLGGDFGTSSELPKFAPTIDYSQDISSYPLVAFQVTRFKCGAVALGTCVHHTLVDGISAVQFVNSWADMARGLPLSVTPCIDRSLLRPRDPPVPRFRHNEYTPPPAMDASDASERPSSEAVFRLTSTQLSILKSKASINGGTAIRYSTYNVLAAHLWRCITKARGLPDDQATKLNIATDGRSRLRPSLPPGYLGNVIFTAAPIATSNDLQTEPLTGTVERIQKSLKRMDDEYVRSALDYLGTVTDLTTLKRGPASFQCPNLNIASWIRLPLHDADFGWGRPIFVRPAVVLFEGTFYILSSSSDDGSLTLIACLETSHIKRFQELLYQF